MDACAGDLLNRRQALASSAAAAAAAAIACNPARALLMTGEERGELMATQSAIHSLRNRTSTFTLTNGMKWIVVERKNAPILSCHTYADVGAADEPIHTSGIAHLLEHLAFKGTSRIGSRNPQKESSLLDQLDEVFYALQNSTSDDHQLRERFSRIQAEASELSIPNEYGALVAREGGVNLNAQTSHDSTEYYVSLPANKLELWMALESGRFIAPVFRDLYVEKEVIKEERRLRVDNTPYGRFTEAFTAAAFPHHPYGRPVIGYPQEFETIGRREVQDFFKKNYIPQNLTCAVVGDADPAQVEKLASKYFGSWYNPNSPPSSSSPLWRRGDGWEEISNYPKGMNLHHQMSVEAQPLYMEGYYKPAGWSTDDPTISVMNDILSRGRLSKFYKNIITKGHALSMESDESYPGDKYPSLMLIYGSSNGTKNLATQIHSQLAHIAENSVDEVELVAMKKASRVSLVEALGSNSAMARILSRYQSIAAGWNGVIQESEDIQSVSPSGILRVASKLFNPSNRVSASTILI